MIGVFLVNFNGHLADLFTILGVEMLILMKMMTKILIVLKFSPRFHVTSRAGTLSKFPFFPFRIITICHSNEYILYCILHHSALNTYNPSCY